MVICCVCGTEMSEDNKIPVKEWDKMMHLFDNNPIELTEIQNIVMFEGYVCKGCYFKG